MTAPIVKWAGGKTQLLPELVKRMPSTYGCYYEPFAGGAALFFHLEPKHAVLSDMNADLMSMYGIVKHRPRDLLHRLRAISATHRNKVRRRSFYASIREAFNQRVQTVSFGPADRAAAFIYLTRTCFNGLYRVNAKGEFNVPMGRYANPKICDPAAIKAASAALRHATLVTDQYQHVGSAMERGDFVYFDPPYDTPFTAYTPGRFTHTDQRGVAAHANVLRARGVHVMISNSDTKFIRSLYKGWKIDRVYRRGTMSSNGKKRGKVAEVIIYDPSGYP